MLYAMSDTLAIIEDSSSDERVVEQIARGHPDRVTVLLEDGTGEPQLDDTPRGLAQRARLSALQESIERSGAVVVGLVANREQLRGWRFDRIVGASGPTTAF
jgi:hypothetical protein